MKKMKKLRILASIALILLLNGCCTDIEIIDTNLGELNKIYPVEVSTYKSELSNTLDIYLDYSKCTKDAVNNGFFKELKAQLLGTSHNLWTIKENEIKIESSEMQESDQILSLVDDVNYADIKGAIDSIVNSYNQALLITDGEYVPNSMDGEQFDQPYFKHSLMNWLVNNKVVYVIIEKYDIGSISKKRFYILFTDDKLKDNYYVKFKESGKLNSPNILATFKITSSDAKGVRTDKRLNTDFDFTSDTIRNTEFISIDNSWKDIYKYTSSVESDENDEDENTNKNLLIKGLKLETLNLTNYKIKNIGIKVFNISDVLLDSLHRKNQSKQILEGLELDKALFAKNGEIQILLTEDFQKYLSSEKENLFKIDIYIESTEVKPLPRDLFIWDAVFAKPNKNTSVYESIKQALEEPLVKPENRNDGLIYTIYLKTPEYK